MIEKKANRELDISQLAKKIKEHRHMEDVSNFVNKAVASYEVSINDRNLTLWLVNGTITASIKFVYDFVGNSGIQKGQVKTLNRQGDHRTFSKNSKMAGELIMAESDEFSFYVDENLNSVRLFSQADFDPFKVYCDATNLTIRFKKEDVLYRFKSLKDIVKQIKTKESEIEELKKLQEYYVPNDNEINEFISQQKKAEDELAQLYEKKQTFILEHAKLRYKAILDPIQERIKRSGFFHKSIVCIDGGPGTGKTTTLIQRIKFLIDPIVVNEHADQFTPAQRAKLVNQEKPSWIFFTPSKLLYLYLKESMTNEGLRATSNTCKVWSMYRTSLMWSYDLSNKISKKPFVLSRIEENEPLIPSEDVKFVNYKKAFEDYFIKSLRAKFVNNGSNVNDKRSSLYKSVLFPLFNDSVADTNSLINVLAEIEINHGKEIRRILKGLSTSIDKAAARVQFAISKDEVLKTSVQATYKKRFGVTVSEGENFEKEAALQKGYTHYSSWLFRYCKNLVRSVAVQLYEYNDGENNKKYFNEIITVNLIASICNEIELKQIGNLIISCSGISYFENGIFDYFLNRISEIYINFRLLLMSDSKLSKSIVDVSVFDRVMSRENNRLHVNEQSFIIGFINSCLFHMNFYYGRLFKKIDHIYRFAYEDQMRMVVAVDEVTDFHIVDLYCMFSLMDKDKYSITVCGDLMQRTTNVGLKKWSYLEAIAPSYIRSRLSTSYRQSPTLLKFASNIYEISTGENLGVVPYLEEHVDEPKPIVKISGNEQDKIRWIANRILNIYEFYGGQMPSVAIFLSNTAKMFEFAEKLSAIEDLSDVGIDVKPCKDGEILGEDSAVRVFSISYIKGLEFEAVFFHNLDDVMEYENQTPDDLLKKIYVGLSRATFYTAVTLKKELPEQLNFLNNHFDSKDYWGN